MSGLPASKVGGWGALLVATFSYSFLLCLLAAGQLALLPEQVTWPHVMADYALALLGLSGLAAVPALSARVRVFHDEGVRWLSTVAQLGFALLSVMSLWQAEYEASMAQASFDLPASPYGTPDADAAPTLLASLTSRMPQGWLEVAGVGLWIAGVSWLARGRRIFPPAMCALGLAAGVCAVGTCVGTLVQSPSLTLLGQVSYGLLLGPAWFFWAGKLLLEEGADARPPEQPAPGRRRRGFVPGLQRWADRHPAFRSPLWHLLFHRS